MACSSQICWCEVSTDSPALAEPLDVILYKLSGQVDVQHSQGGTSLVVGSLLCTLQGGQPCSAVSFINSSSPSQFAQSSDILQFQRGVVLLVFRIILQSLLTKWI